MEQQPQDLWTGGPWEQPSPRYDPPPLPTMPLRRESVLRRRKKRRRALFPFLGLLILIAGLLVGVVATRYLLPQEEGEGLIQSTAQQDQDLCRPGAGPHGDGRHRDHLLRGSGAYRRTDL